MVRLKLFGLKNSMLAIMVIANTIGQVLIAFYFKNEPQYLLFDAELRAATSMVESLLGPIVSIFFFVVQLWYEWPIRRWLNNHFKGGEVADDLTTLARRRLLNEVYLLMGINLFVWCLASAIYSILFWLHDAPNDMIVRIIYVPLTSGLLVVILTFYFMDFLLQKWLVPIFFPQGGLHLTPGVLRVRIHIRMGALILACSFIPVMIFLFLPERAYNSSGGDPAAAFERLQVIQAYHAIFFLGIAVVLAYLLAKNFIRPILEITRVVRGVKEGDLNQRVRVTSNDEIGFAGDILNEMADGLKERQRFQDSLNLAREVQQHLLPRQAPQIQGLDIAGRSVYCDETGGDYYDFIFRGEGESGRIAVVVGDVSDHGVSSALLMATARAFIRRSCAESVTIDAVLGDVNRHLAQAVEETGQFMSLFLLEIDPINKTVAWSNAGHDPALVYEPSRNSFIELRGSGPALAVADEHEYQEYRRPLSSGEIFILGTDGIWEAVGPDGVMFDRQGLKSVVRAHAWMSAEDMVEAVIDELRRFVHPLAFKDDVTLVIIKTQG